MARRGAASVLLPALVLCAISVAGCGSGAVTANNNIQSISITPTSQSVDLGEQVDFSATVTLINPSITTNTTVTWQVNGADGGNATSGTIAPLSTDANVGVYTAPQTAPSTSVSITAIIVESTSTSGTNNTTVTSNAATISFGGVTGISVTPTQASVPAGGTHQFTATLNGTITSAVTWSVSSTNGGNVGSIDSTGLYTAPNVPPPGGNVTITASTTSSGTTLTASATATIDYSDVSLEGPFAFSYTGNNSSGLISVAGRFVADGAGSITSGVEDVESFGNRVATRVSILGGSSYSVGGDGRTKAVVITPNGTETWEFVVTSTQHALMTRFDSGTTGNGSIDQQSLEVLGTNLNSIISGPYVFRASGGDGQFNPMGIAGSFTANGSGGFPASASIVDINDNYSAKTADRTLSGSYSFAANDAGTGRGTLTLSSTNLGLNPLQFAFYLISTTSNGNSTIATQMHVVEIDGVNYLAGDIYLAPSGAPFSSASLASGNYVFTAGGNSSDGSCAEGGVFISGGNGTISGGVLDTNNAGTATANTTVNSSTYSVDPTTGRIDLTLSIASGACGSGSPEFAVYQTAQNTALMLEVDSIAVSTGSAYVQAASPAALSGNFALGFAGQGIFSNAPASYQSNATGHAVLSGSGVSSGDLDISTYGADYLTDPISPSGSTTTTGSSIETPGSNGRGTATIIATDPPATYSLVYYVVGTNTAVFVGQDKTRVETGTLILQY